MAFNNVGPLTFLAPGQTAFWNYSYGADHGTQFASADIKTPNQGAVHLADAQRKENDNNGNATYFVNITNQGPGGCFHNLQGRAGKPHGCSRLFVKMGRSHMMSKLSESMSQAASGRILRLAVIFLLAVCVAMATPVTYTGFTITDGKLGNWSFHNARVYLTLKGDTKNVQFMQPLIDPAHPSFGTVDIWINQTGTTSITIMSGQRVVSANFAPNQIFVSTDLGDTISAPHLGARGIGFGSITSTGGIEPTYPLSVEDGTVDWGDIPEGGTGVASDALTFLPVDLVNNAAFSGRGWVCVGFLNRPPCAPPNALHTDHGDLYLYGPYSAVPSVDQGEDLNAGFFLVQVGESDQEQENVATPAPVSAAPTSTATSEHPITYYGYLISDVTLGGQYYSGAQVYLSFNSDTSNVLPFSSGHGFRNTKGAAHVTIVNGGQQVISAEFDSGQIYVYYDIDHASIGFGSIGNGSTESGYPLSITANQDTDGLVENSLVRAVSDLTLTPADAANFTAATAGLKTNLKNTTLMSGGASSCQGFDPTTSTCSSLTPIPLHTNRGDFLLFEDYRHDALFAGQVTYSVNWGLFWAETAAAEDE